MGKRTRYSHGYNLDDFVASSEEDVAFSDEGSEYDTIQAKSKNKPTPQSKTHIKPKASTNMKANVSVKRESGVKKEVSPPTPSAGAMTPPPSTRTSTRRAKKQTYVFQDAAEDEELDELIGVETDDEGASYISSFDDSSVSDFDGPMTETIRHRTKTTNGSSAEAEDASTSTSTPTANPASPAENATKTKSIDTKPTTPEPMPSNKNEATAAASLPTPDQSPDAKRKRVSGSTATAWNAGSSDSGVEISVFRPRKSTKTEGNVWLDYPNSKAAVEAPKIETTPKKSGSILSHLAKTFGMSARRGNDVTAADLDGGVRIGRDERLERLAGTGGDGDGQVDVDIAVPSVGDGYGYGYECAKGEVADYV